MHGEGLPKKKLTYVAITTQHGTVPTMTTHEVPGEVGKITLLALLSRAADLLRDLCVDVTKPDDHRRGQIEQWLYEAEEVMQ